MDESAVGWRWTKRVDGGGQPGRECRRKRRLSSSTPCKGIEGRRAPSGLRPAQKALVERLPQRPGRDHAEPECWSIQALTRTPSALVRPSLLQSCPRGPGGVNLADPPRRNPSRGFLERPEAPRN